MSLDAEEMMGFWIFRVPHFWPFSRETGLLILVGLPSQSCRSAGMGTGTLNAFIAPPIPFSQVFGGNVHPVPLPWHPAAQNIYPSMPVVVPAPAGARSSTKLAAVF